MNRNVHHPGGDSSHFKYQGGDNPTSTSLLIRLKDGESLAWDTFMQLYTPLIQHWCRRIKDQIGRPDRQDILQEVLAKVSRSIGTFDHAPEGRHFRAWLRRITENTIIDHLNERKKKQDVSQLYSDTGHIKGPIRPPLPIPDPFDFELTEQPNEQIILLRQVMEMIRPTVSEKSWDMLLLLVVDQRPTAEIAAMMELKPDSVRRNVRRICDRLREEYEKLGLSDELPDDFNSPK